MKHRYSSISAALFAAALLSFPCAHLRAADASAARATPEQSAAYISVPMNADTTIYAGTIVCADTDGYARGASLDTSGYTCVGVATRTTTNSGADGATSIRVARGVFKFANSGTNAVDVADLGARVYVEDNQTVSDSTSNSVIAGICVRVESDGVWVDTRPMTLTTGTVDNNSVTSAKIQDGAVAAADLASDSVTTAKILDANVTPVKYNIVEARTVTADGSTTGTISATTTHVTVTSDDANKILVLPAPVVGRVLWIHAGATGFELRSSTPASISINGGSGSGAESAIAANSTVMVICLSSTAWKAIYLDADGDVAKVEAAAP